MRKTELRKVIQTVTTEEMDKLYTLYVHTDQEDRLAIVEAEEQRRKNPKHRDKVVSPQISLDQRLT